MLTPARASATAILLRIPFSVKSSGPCTMKAVHGARALVVTNLTDSVVVYVTFSVVHRQRNEFRCVRHRRDAHGPSKGDLVEDGNAIQYIVKAYDPLRRKFELERRPERAEIETHVTEVLAPQGHLFLCTSLESSCQGFFSRG